MNKVQFLKWLVILNGAVPLVMLAWDGWRGNLGANPSTNALHVTGMLALVFLLLSLAITPLKMVSGWGGWIALRRALGLYAFVYAVVHFGIYVTFDRALGWLSTVNELLSRTFLQLGFVALLLMLPLAITSTNGMQRKLGSKRWKRLHQLAYPIAFLAVAHFFLSVKSDLTEPIIAAVVLVGLLAWRIPNQVPKRKPSQSR